MIYQARHNKVGHALRTSVAAVGAIFLASTGLAWAEDGEKIFSIGGFGTVGATHSSTKNGDYVADLFQPNGPGYTQDWGIGTDSKLATQVDAKFNDQWSAVVQVVATTRSSGTFGPRLEWANVKYAVTPNLSVRVGRTALPTFMVSDSRLIGYANPWIRPPIEIYRQFSYTKADGADLTYRFPIAGVNNTLQAWYGNSKTDLVNANGALNRGVKAHNLQGIAESIEIGAFSARAAYTRSDFIINLGAAGLATRKASVVNLGASYDPGNWFIMGEMARSKLESILRTQAGEYVTAGYRWNSLTPYLTYASVGPNDNKVKLPLRKQRTVSAGLRWDFRKNMDLKVQIDRVSMAEGSGGYFINAKPGLAGSNANIASFVVDFIY